MMATSVHGWTRVLSLQRAIRALARNRILVTFTSLAVVLAGNAIPLGAYAVNNTGMFELDGNIRHDGAALFDWGDLFGSDGKQLLTPNPVNGPLLASVFVKDLATPDKSYFTSNGAGVKDTDATANWGCKSQSTPTPKDNIQNAYAALIRVPTTAAENAGHTVLYLGSERRSNNGDSFAGFWLFRDPSVSCDLAAGHFVGVHSDGDILVLSNYTNGGGTQDVSVYQWSTTANAPVFKFGSGTCGDPQNVNDSEGCALANSTQVSSTWEPTNHPTNTFVEAGVDLTALFGTAGQCFTTFQAETRSSQEITATLKDFANSQFDTCVPPTVTTNATPGGQTLPGAAQHDAAVVAGGTGQPTPTGTLQFALCGPAAVTAAGCPQGAGASIGAPVTLVGGAAFSPTITGVTTPNDLATGKYCWSAAYTPDATSQGTYTESFGTNATSECFNIAKASPLISTVASLTQGSVGTASTQDLVTLHNPSGAPVAGTDTVTFHLYAVPMGTTVSASSCTNNNEVIAALSTQNFTQSAAGADWMATSTAYKPTVAGIYIWTAAFAGDGQNNGTAEPCNGAAEVVTVPRTTPLITTVASSSPSPIVVGTTASVSDSATFQNALSPTGSLVFTLYNNDCTVSTGVTGTATITSGRATFTGAFSPTAPGTYQFTVSYAGDANNAAITTSCGDANEQISVITTRPVVTTQASPVQPIVVGAANAAIGDTASFHNSFEPTGSVTYALYSLSTCTPTSRVVSGSGAISGSVASFSTSHTFTETGTYYWVASYAGDANNAAYTSGCTDQNEQIQVIPAAPDITTQSSPKTAEIQGLLTVSDTATITGGFNVSGQSISFTLYHSTDCTNSTGIHGSGTITTSNGVSTASFSSSWTPTATGTYYWVASYAGDANNNTFTSACHDTNEVVAVGAPASNLHKQERDVTAAGSFVDGPITAFPGDTLQYQLVYTNAGNAAATAVVLTDVVPTAHATYVVGSCSLTCSYDSDTHTLTWSLGTVQPGADNAVTMTFEIVLDSVFPSGTTSISNVGVATTHEESGTTPSNTVVANVPAAPSSAILKAQRDVTTPDTSQAAGGFTAATINAHPGDVLEYRLTYTNSGNAPATNTLVTDPVPTRSTFLSCTGGCSQTATAVTWNLGTVPPGTVVLTFQVTLNTDFAAGTETQITNAAVVTTTEQGTLPSNQVIAVVAVGTVLAAVTPALPKAGAGPHPQGGWGAFPGLVALVILLTLAVAWQLRGSDQFAVTEEG